MAIIGETSDQNQERGNVADELRRKSERIAEEVDNRKHIIEPLQAEIEQLKQSCEAHAEYAKQRLEKLQEAEADNKRLHALLRDINQYTSRIVEQALDKP